VATRSIHAASALGRSSRKFDPLLGLDFRNVLGDALCAERFAISWGCVSQSCVDPSISASRSVTVPVGSSLTPKSLWFTGGMSARGLVSLMLASIDGRQRHNISETAQI
jgi:hypothetical protein